MHFPHHPGGGPGGGGFGHGGGPGGFGGGFPSFGTIVTDIAAGLVFIVAVAIVFGLLFLIVRFLISMTRAADLYVAQNSRTVDVATTTETAPPTKPAPARFPWGGDAEAQQTTPTTRTTSPKTTKPKA